MHVHGFASRAWSNNQGMAVSQSLNRSAKSAKRRFCRRQYCVESLTP
jgi:hypothetical protein